MELSIPSIRCFEASILAAIIVVFLPAASRAQPHDMLVFPLSIRSAGMGDTGNADFTEIANNAYNPSLIGFMNNIEIAWGHSYTPYVLADIKLDGLIAGVGHRWRLNETTTIGGGMAAGYVKERYGSKGFDEHEPVWGSFERSYNLAAACAVGFRNRACFCLGIDMKRWKWDNGSENEDFRQIAHASVCDAGLAASVLVLDRNDYKIEASAGFAYSNFGGKIETERDPIFFTPHDDYTAPAYRRYGLGVRFASPSWSRADAKFETDLPVVSASFNYDIIDDVYFSRFAGVRQALGGELGAFTMLFLRAGRIDYEERGVHVGEEAQNFTDATWGVGVGTTFRRFHLRFDYAQRHIDNADETNDRYGLVFDVRF